MTATLENGEDSALNQASERVLQQHRATSKKELCDPVGEAITAAVDFLSAFAEESDRAAAVLAHACFEVWLKDTIKRAFVEIDGDFEKKHHIFQPIQSFLSKIKIGLALGLYDQKTFEGLLTVNEIRNRFAHHHEIIDFSDQKIADLCRKLDTKKPFDASDFRAKYTTYLNEVRDGVELPESQLSDSSN